MQNFARALIISACLVTLSSPFTAKAQDSENTAAQSATSPKIKELNDKIMFLTKDLSDLNRQHFFTMYNNHNIITTVKTVKTDVSNAIDECSKKNPEIKTDLKSRFSQWDKAVSAQLDEAKAQNQNMVLAQTYTTEENITHILDKADELRDETAMKIKKVPVTNKEACEYLLNKMDETQDTMISLLKATLIRFPQQTESLPDSNTETDETTPEN